MKKIFACSPWRGNHDEKSALDAEREHIVIAGTVCRKIVDQGDMPVAPHLFFTRFLDDNNTEERKVGCVLGGEQLIECGEMWVYAHCCGVSKGMQAEIGLARKMRIPIIWLSREYNDE